jgi:hypothetical protein
MTAHVEHQLLIRVIKRDMAVPSWKFFEQSDDSNYKLPPAKTI